jgi:hypothetical protein
MQGLHCDAGIALRCRKRITAAPNRRRETRLTFDRAKLTAFQILPDGGQTVCHSRRHTCNRRSKPEKSCLVRSQSVADDLAIELDDSAPFPGMIFQHDSLQDFSAMSCGSHLVAFPRFTTGDSRRQPANLRDLPELEGFAVSRPLATVSRPLAILAAKQTPSRVIRSVLPDSRLVAAIPTHQIERLT